MFRFGFYVRLHIFIIALINFNAFTMKRRTVLSTSFFGVWTLHMKIESKKREKKYIWKTHAHTNQMHIYKMRMEIIQVTLSNIFFWRRWDRTRTRRLPKREQKIRDGVEEEEEESEVRVLVRYEDLVATLVAFRNSQIYEIAGIREPEKRSGLTALH